MRYLYLDVARTIALLLIVFTHVKELLFSHCWPYAFSNNQIKFFLYTIDRLGVPLFFFISGALMIAKEIRNGYTHLWRRVFIFIFLTSLYSILTNFVGFYFFNSYSVVQSLCLSLKQNNFIYGSGSFNYAVHLWFMLSIINIYIFLPYISIFVNSCSCKKLYSFLAINLVIYFIPGIFEYKSNGVMHNVLMLSKFYKEFCGIYLCYFISGYLIHKHIAFNFDKEKNVKIIDYELTKKFFSFPKTWITDKKVLFVFLILGLLSHNALLFLNKDLAWKSTWYANSPFIFFNSLLLYLIIPKTLSNFSRRVGLVNDLPH